MCVISINSLTHIVVCLSVYLDIRVHIYTCLYTYIKLNRLIVHLVGDKTLHNSHIITIVTPYRYPVHINLKTLGKRIFPSVIVS